MVGWDQDAGWSGDAAGVAVLWEGGREGSAFEAVGGGTSTHGNRGECGRRGHWGRSV